ncbi:TPA: hypothetical protein ACG0TZ_003308 [Acinetobacter baumannii]
MDKCREEFENSLERTDGFHEGYVTWNEASGMYMANDDDYECMADWMNGAFAIYRKMQAKVEELQKRVDFLEKHLKPCECGSKEIWVDREGYITKHCYRCGGIKTQEMLEQALKGEGQ